MMVWLELFIIGKASPLAVHRDFISADSPSSYQGCTGILASEDPYVRGDARGSLWKVEASGFLLLSRDSMA